tara:strand:+ start:354 stop:992 length:639 start_codon:yes stop_codon:yes gene_type:complete
MVERSTNGDLLMIFPTTLFVRSYREDFKKEFKYIRNLEYEGQQVTGAFRTKDSYLLKHPELSKIKAFVLESLDMYADTVLGTKQRLSITQAWIQRNPYGSFTHEHTHANSLVSGVFYFRNEEHASITFTKNEPNRIRAPIHKNTRLNSDAFQFKPLSGDVILFPSGLRHSVPVNVKQESRYCLAFNAFCFNELGVEGESTHLTFKDIDEQRR